ncbi:piggyBac transposable element-derived protein 4-like [Melitaea cinxia]|uniref:piggyBac transposable element-derived protein 4-like n=1 Tax=Melitaea cinxia TaxID=113334 RepID=UPI001E2714E0|nr:piggyBac transposable element-derived protein 4-like [Melitaea cinxia]XP_045451954.1 piggyBac transposable element-derived protein 4-like [Melitaea cinxia]
MSSSDVESTETRKIARNMMRTEFSGSSDTLVSDNEVEVRIHSTLTVPLEQPCTSDQIINTTKDDIGDDNARANSPSILMCHERFDDASDIHEISCENSQNDTDEWVDVTAEIPLFHFDYASEGLKVEIPNNAQPLDIFKLIFSNDLLDFVVSRTNAYGNNLTNTTRPHTRHSRKCSFRDVTKEEMLAFLGLCLLQGQIKIPNRRKLFSYSDPLNFHPIFSYVMSSRRFDQILRAIYVSDIEAKSEKKITGFIEALSENFRRVYGPGKELSLDESLVLYRGRLYFRQYIKSKKARYGIKFYMLTSATGYVLNIIMYCGKGEDDNTYGKKTEQIVMKLLKPYLMKGHHVFMDNFYNDVDLSQKLLELRTHTNGTLRKNRKTNPKGLTQIKLKKGDFFWCRKKQVYVSAWCDKRPVYVITTRNHPKLINVSNRFGKISQKPEEVSEYNKYMGGIDRKDQMVAYYSSPQKTIRWYKKVFFHLLDISVWNSFFVYKKYFKNDVKYEFLDYREDLIKQMINLESGCSGRNIIRTGSIYSSRRTAVRLPKKVLQEENLVRISQDHWPEDIPCSTDSKRNFKYLNCSLCTKKKKRKETRYRCKGCREKTPLCPTCFEEWHAKYVKRGDT